MSKLKPFYQMINGKLEINPHPGQLKVLQSTKRLIAVNSGRQAGKTTLAPLWTFFEIQKWDKRLQAGEVVHDADFMAVAPTFPLLSRKMIPTYIEFFIDMLGIGDMHIQKNLLTVDLPRDDGSSYTHNIFFGSAKNPESLASVTAAAIVIDEAGQDMFSYKAWDELFARTGSTGGRILLCSTLYNWNWYKTKIYDEWKKGSDMIDVITFKSIDNPFFSIENWNHARATMTPAEFSMKHLGEYARPAAMIFDAFRPDIHIIKAHDIGAGHPIYIGVDPGIIHHDTIYLARFDPGTQYFQSKFPHATGDVPVYLVYKNTLLGSETTTVTAKDQAQALREEIIGMDVRTIAVGAKAEKYTREDYCDAGFNALEPPTVNVEDGIQAMYYMVRHNLLYFMDDVDNILDEIQSYARMIDETGEVTDKIADKSTYHAIDALRYIVLHLVDLKRRTAGNVWGAVLGDSYH